MQIKATTDILRLVDLLDEITTALKNQSLCTHFILGPEWGLPYSYSFNVKEAMHIKWENPTLLHLLQHLDFSLCF